MGLFDWIAAAENTPMTKAATLTADEQRQLARLEAQVDAGIGSVNVMIDAGKALATIRDRQLHRASAATWDEYVHARFKMTKRRADQLVSFAGVTDALQKMGTVVPEISERAARPLAGMDSDTVLKVIEDAANDPNGVTPASIRKAASRRKPKAAKAPRPVRLKVPGAIVVVTLNAKAAKSGIDIEAALVAALDAHRRDRDGRAGEAA